MREPKLFLATRHAGAVEWARRQGWGNGEVVSNWTRDLCEQIVEGDAVIGNLPIYFVAEICARGGRFYLLSMRVPAALRGVELTADHMETLGVRLERYEARLLSE